MQRCLQLAAGGEGLVAPNPLVGAVLVYNDRIIGEGFHMHYGKAHAEVNCLAAVKEEDRPLIPLSTLYVSLEPCSHFGKTPPCADLIIENRITEVIVACTDPFNKVNGGGIEKLVNAGVNVRLGVLEEEAKELNKRFFTYHTKHRPYIILKWAESADRKIAAADYSAVKISNFLSNTLVHKWRSQESSIMVGFNTAKFDDPSLTNRHWTGNDPLRIVLDPMLELNAALKLFSQDVPTLVVNHLKSSTEGAVKYCNISNDGSLIENTLKLLFEERILSVIVEGGTRLIQAFLDAGYWDEIRVIKNSKLRIENGIHAPVMEDLVPSSAYQLAGDEHTFYRNSSKNI